MTDLQVIGVAIMIWSAPPITSISIFGFLTGFVLALIGAPA